MICLKISTFAVSTTTELASTLSLMELWFAWKYLPLRYQQQQTLFTELLRYVVICLKISTFAVSTTTYSHCLFAANMLWFAWKYLPLRYQQQRKRSQFYKEYGCDLLKNIYLCGINNNHHLYKQGRQTVVICLKISIFVVSTTTTGVFPIILAVLWFA